MTLRDKALATVPLCAEYIESIWNDRNSNFVDDLRTYVRSLVLSHERLRAELEGAEAMLAKRDLSKFSDEERAMLHEMGIE